MYIKVSINTPNNYQNPVLQAINYSLLSLELPWLISFEYFVVAVFYNK